VRVTTADDPDAMRSITLVKVRSCSSRACRPAGHELLEVTIKTGRTHQIRVHLASQGHPSWATTNTAISISTAVAKAGLKRMFLHAWRLQFNHPASGERIELRAELPAELADFVA
jgi:23S rRNA pseudouridine955/2504/2580 synthase